MDRYTLDDIKAAMDKGELTPDQIGEKLQYIVEMEYQKPYGERDEQFILTCEKLLYELYTGHPYVSRKEEHKQELLKMLDERPARRRFNSPLMKMFICVFALITCAVLAGGFLHRQWFSFGPSPDYQQYVVQGHEIDPQLIARSIAEHTGISKLETDTLSELTSFIGFPPGLPVSLAETWSATEYYALIQPASIAVTGYYTDAGHVWGTLMYSIQYYSDSKSAYWSFEQNINGELESIAGKDVYFTSNLGKSSALWVMENSIHQIAGAISKDELILLANRILGEINHE